MNIRRHIFLRAVSCCVLVALTAGCVAPVYDASGLAERMTATDRTWLERTESQQQLLRLGDEAEPHLDRAFFPIGLYDVPRDALTDVAAAGFNLVVNGDKDDTEYLYLCKALGIRLIPYVNLDKMSRDVQRARGQKPIWAWYLFDEPDLNQRAPEFIGRQYHALRKADPTRPVYLTVLSPRRYADFARFCDIFAPNPYPVVHRDARKNQLRHVAIAVEVARKAAPDKPVWTIIQAFWAKPHWQRNPTPGELRAMVYLAVNHGAKGIIYFSYKSGGRPITKHAKLFAAIRRVNGELSAMKALLLKDPLPGAASAHLVSDARGGIVVGRPRWPAADCSVRTLRGRPTLIVVNPDPWTKTVRVTLDGAVATRSRALEFFAGKRGKNIPVEKGSLLLKLRPFQVRLFDLE